MKTNSRRGYTSSDDNSDLFISGKIVLNRLYALFKPVDDGIHFQITERTGMLPISWLFCHDDVSEIFMVTFIWRFGLVIAAINRAFVVVANTVTGIVSRKQFVPSFANWYQWGYALFGSEAF